MLRKGQKSAVKAQSQTKKASTTKRAVKNTQKRTLKTPARRSLKAKKAGPTILASAKVFRPTLPTFDTNTNAPNNGWVEDSKGVKRPVSPSFQIWNFTPVAYMHVGSRIAGGVLAGGMTVAGLYGAMIGCDVTTALDAIKINAPILVPILKMSIVLPLSYHSLHGVRQLYQDFTAKGYDEEFQEKSSYAIAGISAAATIYGGLIV